MAYFQRHNIIRYAVIPAAGIGSRMSTFELAKILPKCLFPIVDKPIIEGIIELLHRSGVDNIFIIVNYKQNVIKSYLKDGKRYGVKINYLVQKQLNGVAGAIFLARKYIKEPFFTVLADTFLIKDNLLDLKNIFLKNKAYAAEYVCRESSKIILSNTCSVKMKNNKIISLTEKPKSPTSKLRGAGIYVFDPIIFDYIKAAQNSKSKVIEITNVLDTIAKEGKCYGLVLKEEEVNVNRPEDLVRATQVYLKHLKGKHIVNK